VRAEERFWQSLEHFPYCTCARTKAGANYLHQRASCSRTNLQSTENDGAQKAARDRMSTSGWNPHESRNYEGSIVLAVTAATTVSPAAWMSATRKAAHVFAAAVMTGISYVALAIPRFVRVKVVE
jgi:hypothetical protein